MCLFKKIGYIESKYLDLFESSDIVKNRQRKSFLGMIGDICWFMNNP